MKKSTLFLIAIVFSVLVPLNMHSQCTASFVYSVGANGNVTFSSTSTGTTSTTLFTWYIGGLQGVSSASGTAGWTASTQYTVNGTYVVQLAIGATATACYSMDQQTITVTSSTNNCALSAGFFASTTNTTQVFKFDATSSGTVPGTTYSWDFGDGSTGTGANVLHTYSNSAVVTIQMVADNNFVPTCTSVANTFINICTTVTGTLTPVIGAAGQVTIFCPTTGSTAATVYTWNVNGSQGTWQSNLANPTFTLPNGSYQVYLHMKPNSSSSCLSAGDDTLFISNSSACVLSSNFSFNGNGNTWNFINNTQNTNTWTNYLWDFGDGNTTTQFSPSHTYTVPGVYTVSLTAQNGQQMCASIFTAQISTSCVANAGFTLVPTTTAQVWNAIPASTANIASATWSWGDGSNSNSLFTSHQYSAAGMYSICLSVTTTCGASNAACASYSVYRTKDAAAIVYVNVVPSSGGGVISGISDNGQRSPELFVYPNPGKGNFEIRIDGTSHKTAKVYVFDVSGKIVFCSEMLREKDGLSLSGKIENAAAGVYTLKIEAGELILTKKLIIEK